MLLKEKITILKMILGLKTGLMMLNQLLHPKYQCQWMGVGKRAMQPHQSAQIPQCVNKQMFKFSQLSKSSSLELNC